MIAIIAHRSDLTPSRIDTLARFFQPATPLDDTELLQRADLCVKCGLCLPKCPTYRLFRDEAESPRGRISLIQGLIQGELTADSQLEKHLRRCLHCLSCQRACPSKVPYQALIDAALARLPAHPSGRNHRLARLPQQSLIRGTLSLFRRSPLYPAVQRWLPESLASQLRLLPTFGLTTPTAKPLPGPIHAQLFLGCVSGLADDAAQRAFLRLSEALGLSIEIPKGQDCCGALHQHQGNADRANACAATNAKAFAGTADIISFSSGCGSQLQAQFGERLRDASDFLLAHWHQQPLPLLPLNAPIALHTPCTLSDALPVQQLLQLIPDVVIHPLPMADHCCGGAGHQLLEQPEVAHRLAEPLITQLRHMQPAVLITSNAGCALHLRQSIGQANLSIEVLHPIELLARQISWSTMG